jgi:hypothetical protein
VETWRSSCMLHATWEKGRGSWALYGRSGMSPLQRRVSVLFSYVKMYFEFQLLLLVFLLFRYFVVAGLI